MRKLIVEIGREAEVKLEFVGFVGDSCSKERERIRKILLEWGIDLAPKDIQRKTPAQIVNEIGNLERPTGKAGYG